MKNLKKCPTKANFKNGNVSLTVEELSKIEVDTTLLIVLRPLTGVYTTRVVTRQMVDSVRLAPGYKDVVLMPFSDKAIASIPEWRKTKLA